MKLLALFSLLLCLLKPELNELLQVLVHYLFEQCQGLLALLLDVKLLIFLPKHISHYLASFLLGSDHLLVLELQILCLQNSSGVDPSLVSDSGAVPFSRVVAIHVFHSVLLMIQIHSSVC